MARKLFFSPRLLFVVKFFSSYGFCPWWLFFFLNLHFFHWSLNIHTFRPQNIFNVITDSDDSHTELFTHNRLLFDSKAQQKIYNRHRLRAYRNAYASDSKIKIKFVFFSPFFSCSRISDTKKLTLLHNVPCMWCYTMTRYQINLILRCVKYDFYYVDWDHKKWQKI